ncbi:MAG TPA: hypothetical protein ENJ95_04295 [Bacteroidetes bacterium]|nr:hypothetical protein [Bacteroidota bacterium]
MATSESSKQRLLIIASIVIAVLLFVNAFLLFNKYKQDRVIEEQTSQISEADKLKTEMNKQYHEALAELEEMRTSNEELNSIIDGQKEELKKQREKITRLLKNGGNLDRARAEIRNLTAQVAEYVAQVEQLKADNDLLRDENEQLSSKTRELSDNLASERSRNEDLSGQNEELANVKSQLSQERDRLANKVNLASVIKVKSVSVDGMKERNNGKLVKKRYAKNVSQLRICFSTEANDVANPGVEQFFVRIINPIGETMAIEELGSGVLIDKSTGDEVRYTSATESDYNNAETNICFNWNPNMPFQKGKYQVEIYNKGHLAGSGEFSLK